jgi:signal transduction histidine kinase
MADHLAILHLEDSPMDSDLVGERLRRGGLEAKVVRVGSKEEFQEALAHQRFDVILADYYLLDFDGDFALTLARAAQPEVPFIFVTGRLGEEVAVETLRQGATDYVLKDRLDRLVPAVYRALAEAAERDRRHKAEEALRESDRRKDEFLAMLAHELRNPLAPIRNAVQVLRYKGDDPVAVEQMRQMVDRQVQHVARIVDDLLDVSRIRRGKIRVRRERLDLTRLTRLNVEDNSEAFEHAGVALRMELPAGPVWVQGDATRLAQVLDNLLNNAAKFTERGGEVTVTLGTEEERGTAVLSVRDTGIGMDPELLARLFEPFSQADRTLDRSMGGLGLGLALVKGLIALHGGEVEATSEGAGRGAKFTLRLPMEKELEALEEKTVKQGLEQKHLRVLIVEDNRDSAESLRVLLELFGHEVSLAYSGPEGVEAAKQSHPDVVVCDIGLPGMDGFAVAEALRHEPETAEARLIAVTGYGREEDRRRAFEAGFDEHLVKPVDPEKLLEQLTVSSP